jgi:hypothetical protein
LKVVGYGVFLGGGHVGSSTCASGGRLHFFQLLALCWVFFLVHFRVPLHAGGLACALAVRG